MIWGDVYFQAIDKLEQAIDRLKQQIADMSKQSDEQASFLQS